MAEQKIAQAEAQAVAEVKARSADIAIAAAERVLAARVKGDQAAALIEKSIDDVRKRLN
jgi:F-type H+-transporting ATPase subunit b